MPNRCCISKCKKSTNDGFHLFRFPFKRPEILKLWIDAIGSNFQPKENQVICSAHFVTTDYMERPNVSGVRLKNLAVPSIFFEPVITVPTVSTANTSTSAITSSMKLLNDDITCTSFVHIAPVSTCTSSLTKPTTSGKSILKPQISSLKEENSTLPIQYNDLILLPSTVSAGRSVDTFKMTMRKPRKIMRSSLLNLKKQEMSPRKRLMQRKIKTLTQKLRRKEEKISSLKKLLQNLRAKKLLEKDPSEVIAHNFDGSVGELFRNEWINKNRKRKGCRYSDEIKKFAVTMHFYSPKAYNYCRSILRLPHQSSIRNWISSINAEPGFMINVFQEISKVPESSRHCNLVFDSMAIRKQILWDATSEKFVGLCEYGNEIFVEAAETEATEVLVFMLVSLRGTCKWPIGYFFVNKINATVQTELIKTALIMSHQWGIRVWSVTCDGAYVNYTTMNLLGCNLYTTNYCDLKSTFKHPSCDYDVHFVPDACHNVKLARNAFGDLKILKSPSAQISWNHITNLHKLQHELNLKFANKLSSAHINFKANIMKVKLAAQTLSSSTAAALEFLQFTEIEEFKDCAGTIEFIKAIDEIFDFLNSRNPFGKGFKKPVFLCNINFLQQKIEQKIEYLYTLMDSVIHINNDYNDNFFNNSDNEELYRSVNISDSFLQQNILYYVAGFIVKKLIPKLTCKGCIANVITKVSDSHNISFYSILIDVKNNGGLVYASNHVHKIVCATENEFQQSLPGQHKLPHKDAYSKIIQKVTQRYALDTNVFSNDDCYEEFEIGADTPHRLQLIKFIYQKYLTIRMYSYSKILTKDIINPTSKRQKLTKLILFSNT